MTRTEIKEFARFAKAQRLSDVDDLSALLTDDFKLVGPLGFVVPKQEWVQQFRTGMLQIQSLEWDEIDIRTHAYAYFAIAIGRLTQAATYARNRAGGQFRVTAIAIGHGTSWHLAGAHYSPITAPRRPHSKRHAQDKEQHETAGRHPPGHRPIKRRRRNRRAQRPPKLDGPTLHHHDFDEAFYVLDGELTFQLGETLRAAGPGELVFAPRGIFHTLANVTERQALYVLVCTPGQFTRYFEQLSATASTNTATATDKRYPETTVVGPTIPERLSRAA